MNDPSIVGNSLVSKDSSSSIDFSSNSIISTKVLRVRPKPQSIFVDDKGYATLRWLEGRDKHDLNITFYEPLTGSIASDRGGVFVASNGAGIMANTVDLLQDIYVAGSIDLKNKFTTRKIRDSLLMAIEAQPVPEIIILNIMSGTARGSAVVNAIEAFYDSIHGKLPALPEMYVRFSGSELNIFSDKLEALIETGRPIYLFSGTHQLSNAVKLSYGVSSRENDKFNAQGLIESAILQRLSHHPIPIRPCPKHSLTELFGSKDSAIGVFGLGETAQTHIRGMIECGQRIAWIVAPQSTSERREKFINEVLSPNYIKVFESINDATVEAGSVSIMVNYAPARNAAESLAPLRSAKRGISTIDASSPQLMILAAENLSTQEGIWCLKELLDQGIRVVGPNSPGVMILEGDSLNPSLRKLGNMPAHLFRIKGPVAVLGRSGTAVFDVVEAMQEHGKLGIRFAAAIGGDGVRDLDFVDYALMLEHDSETDCIVITGEAGGESELALAELMRSGHITKPVIALMVGLSLPGDVRCGHAGAVTRSGNQDPLYKLQELQKAGVICVSSALEAAEIAAAIADRGISNQKSRDLKEGWHRLHCEMLFRKSFDSHLALTAMTPESVDKAYRRHPFYVQELSQCLERLPKEEVSIALTDVIGIELFQSVLQKLPWATSILNEICFVGPEQFISLIQQTVGIDKFRKALLEKPWNTTHFTRTINATGSENFAKTYSFLTSLLNTELNHVEISFERNPWSIARLVKWVSRLSDLEQQSLANSKELIERIRDCLVKDPGLLSSEWENTFISFRPNFLSLLPDRLNRIKSRVSLEDEINKLGKVGVNILREKIFTGNSYELAKSSQTTSFAYALRDLNDTADGLQRIMRAVKIHEAVLKGPDFELGAARNPWMVTGLLLTLSEVSRANMEIFVNTILTPAVFRYALKEHQWGINRALDEIAHLGDLTRSDNSQDGFHRFYSSIDWLESHVAKFTESWRLAFSRNPRDAVRVIQELNSLDEAVLQNLLLGDHTSERRQDLFRTSLEASPRFLAIALRDLRKLIERDSTLEEFDLSAEEFLNSLATNTVIGARAINRGLFVISRI